MTIQGHPPFFLKPQPRFVTLRGGEYLLPAQHGRSSVARSGPLVVDEVPGPEHAPLEADE